MFFSATTRSASQAAAALVFPKPCLAMTSHTRQSPPASARAGSTCPPWACQNHMSLSRRFTGAGSCPSTNSKSFVSPIAASWPSSASSTQS
ncbi:MAG TPA: hypothetical protein VF552_10255 [Allosphingosinicella sp.]